MPSSRKEHDGGAVLILSSFLFVVVGYVINIWLGKRLGPEEYGSYVVVISLMTTLNLVQTAGLPQAVAKFVADNRSRPGEVLNSGLRLQLILTLALTAVLFLGAKYFAQILRDPNLIPFLRLSSIILPLYGLYALYGGYRNGLSDFTRQGLMNVLYSLCKLIFVVLLTLKFGLYGAIYGFIAAPIAALIVGYSHSQAFSNRYIKKIASAEPPAL